MAQKCTNLFTTISLLSEVIVSTCLSGDGDLRSPTVGLKKTDYIIYKDLVGGKEEAKLICQENK